MDKLKVINTKTSLRNYKIFIKNGIASDGSVILKNIFSGCSKIFLVTDQNIFSLYNDKIKQFLENSGLIHRVFNLSEGEEQKNIDAIKKIYESLIDFNFHKDDIIIAFGGGVIGDISGFVASTFHRGVKLVQFPTTLVAQIDSSIGGKTGININKVKNAAGTIYQPHMIIIDPLLLKSLAGKEIANGLAEMIKYGAIFNRKILKNLKMLADSAKAGNFLKEIITRTEFCELIYKCCMIKADVVHRDEYDKGYRNLLNFGHTFGHALEKITDAGINHGQAVAYGMLMAVDASILTGNAKNSLKQYFLDIYNSLKMPVKMSQHLFKDEKSLTLKQHKPAISGKIKNSKDLIMPVIKPVESKIIEAMQFDKKFSSMQNKFILLKDIGKPFFSHNLDENILREVIKNNISEE